MEGWWGVDDWSSGEWRGEVVECGGVRWWSVEG